MIDTTQTSSAAAAASSAKSSGTSTASSTDSAAGTEDRFLKLLVAQMRNQDPLNPLDNAQVTSQLAQINTVRGIEQLNDSMTKMAAASGSISPVSAVGLLGRQVLVAGEEFEWSGADGSVSSDVAVSGASSSTRSVRLGFELPAAAKMVRVEIVDPAGRTVYSRETQNADAGVQTFDWTGVDADGDAVNAGKYRIRVYGAGYDGGQVSATALVPARVSGVAQGADGARIELAGRSALSASAIRAIL